MPQSLHDTRKTVPLIRHCTDSKQCRIGLSRQNQAISEFLRCVRRGWAKQPGGGLSK
jgi:hypothetical protein